MKETCLSYTAEDEHAFFSSSETKWINKIQRLQKEHPDEVQIIHKPENNGGMIYAHIPKKYLKISPPRQMNYTDEQKAAMTERLMVAREKKGD